MDTKKISRSTFRFSRIWIVYWSVFAGAAGTVAIITMMLVGLALSALFTEIPASGNWHFLVALIAGVSESEHSWIAIAPPYLLVLFAMVLVSWLGLALVAVAPGIVVGLVYELLHKFLPRRLVSWIIYAVAGVGALPSSVFATQSQFERVPYIWVPAALLIGICTCIPTLAYRRHRGEEGFFCLARTHGNPSTSGGIEK